MPVNKLDIQATILILTGGLIAFIWLFLITTRGPGVSPDSTVYVETADNLIAGKGFYASGEPLTHYPSLYPLLLAMAKIAIPDTLLAGRWLHAFLFAINVMLVATAAYIFTKQRSLLPIGGAIILFLASTPVLITHTMAWSESPFITFSLAGLILLALYISKPRLSLLLISSLLLGFAIATRYVGLVLLCPLLFGILILNQKPFREKIHHVILAMVVALTPVGLWLLRNTLVAESATNRQLTPHLVEWRHLADLVNTLSDFVLPLPVPSWIKTIHVTFLLLLFAVILRQFYRAHRSEKRIESGNAAFVSLNLVYILSYIAFLLASISFFDAHTPLDSRLLLPVYISLILIAVLVVSSLVSKWQRPISRLSLFFFFSLIVVLNGAYAIREAGSIQQNGFGYTSQMWQDSAILDSVTSLDSEIKIYSNGVDVIRFLTGRESQRLPYLYFTATLLPNSDYVTQITAICNEVREAKAVIVYFDNIQRSQYPTREALASQCHGISAQELSDGVIFDRSLDGR
jgi:hypothetical protein